MERSSFDGMVTSNQSLQAIVEAGRVEPENAVAVSLKPNELAQVEADQLPANSRTRKTTARPADKPIIARRPFQISA